MVDKIKILIVFIILGSGFHSLATWVKSGFTFLDLTLIIGLIATSALIEYKVCYNSKFCTGIVIDGLADLAGAIGSRSTIWPLLQQIPFIKSVATIELTMFVAAALVLLFFNSEE